MRIHRFIAILIVLPLLSMACAILPGLSVKVIRGSGKIISETRDVKDFHSVSLSGSGDLIITQGSSESLRIDAEDNIMPLLESEVRGGTLYLGFKPNLGAVMNTQPVKFYLGVKTLDSAVLSGSGSIQADSLKATNFSLTSSGSGNINIPSLTADTLILTITGSGNASIGGVVGQQTAQVSGSGEYQAGSLDTQQTTAVVTGSGTETVWARDSLNITLSGSGSVSYYGKPAVNQVITGSGKVTNLGVK